MTEEYRFRKTNAEKINDVLYDVWDPLRINSCAPRDEYQSYVSRVQTGLEEGVSEEAIFRCLQEIEREFMCGVTLAGAAQTRAAAKALVGLYLPPSAAVAFDS